MEGVVMDTFVADDKDNLFKQFEDAKADGRLKPYYRAHLEEIRVFDATDKLKGDA
ncbi:hypothetical protein [Fructobacillus sp. CRL 2054]|uniref:hypothetical protein n=1 Tax=Fructobacillus sp. CRL 2054 TaxID=2763007 RepID=UPI00237A0418|nr:hypothetical protein [Fructobacillus sp. CRL 2054]